MSTRISCTVWSWPGTKATARRRSQHQKSQQSSTTSRGANSPEGGFMTDGTDNTDKIVRLAAYQAMASNDAPLTEDAAALAFMEQYRNKLRFDHHIGKWFVYTGARWQLENTGLAFSWARDLVRQMAKDAPDKTKFISSKVSFASAVEKFARTDRAFAVT